MATYERFPNEGMGVVHANSKSPTLILMSGAPGTGKRASKNLSVRPEPVEGQFMVRQAHHERGSQTSETPS